MKLTTKGFKELSKRLDSDQTVRMPLFTAVRNSATAVMIAAKNTAPVGATGQLKRSIQMRLDQTNLRGIVGFDQPGQAYAKYVEFGTGPHFPPIDAIRRWATQKGINPYAVQQSIGKKGTKAHPFFLPAYEKNLSYIKGQFSKALKQITRAI